MPDVNQLYDHLFESLAPVPCEDAADANDDGSVNVQDLDVLVAALMAPSWLVAAIPAPTETCDADPTLDGLGCDTYTGCAGCSEETCETMADSSGIVSLPPPCGYQNFEDTHEIVDGLPPGTTVEVSMIHFGFEGTLVTPGGDLGGDVELFDSDLTLEMEGTGDLEGVDIVVEVEDVPVEVHTSEAQPDADVQEIETEMKAVEGEVVGDPNFALLHITAGAEFGQPSFGHTRLIKLTPPGADIIGYKVESYFEVHYTITYIGAEGSPFEGLSGVSSGVAIMRTPGTPLSELPFFRRGDANADGTFDISDPVWSLAALFSSEGAAGLPCYDAGDSNDDGVFNIGDAVYSLAALFTGTAAIPQPSGAGCGVDPTDDLLQCDSYGCL